MTATSRRYRPSAKANKHVATGMIAAAIAATFWWLIVFIDDQGDHTAAYNQQFTLMRMFDQTSPTDGPRDDAARGYRQRLARQLLQVPTEVGRHADAETIWVEPEKLAVAATTGDPLDLGSPVEVPGWGQFFGGLIWPIGLLIYCVGGLALLLVWRKDSDQGQRLLDLDWDHPTTRAFAALSLPVLLPCLAISYLRTRELTTVTPNSGDQTKVTEPTKAEPTPGAAQPTKTPAGSEDPTVYTSPVGKFTTEDK